MPSFNPTDQANIEHGVVQAHADYADVIAAASPIEVGLVGKGISDTSPKYTLTRRIETSAYDGNNDSHDGTAAGNTAKFCPEKIHIVNVVVGSATVSGISHFSALSGLQDAANDSGVVACTLPYHINSDTLVDDICELLAQQDTFYGTHLHTIPSYPGSLIFVSPTAINTNTGNGPDFNMFVSCLVGFECLNNTAGGPLENDVYDPPEILGVGTWAGNASTSAPIVTSGGAFLRLLDPSVPATDIRNLLFNNTETRMVSGTPVKFMRVDLAANAMMAGFSPGNRKFWSLGMWKRARNTSYGGKSIEKVLGVNV